MVKLFQIHKEIVGSHEGYKNEQKYNYYPTHIKTFYRMINST